MNYQITLKDIEEFLKQLSAGKPEFLEPVFPLIKCVSGGMFQIGESPYMVLTGNGGAVRAYNEFKAAGFTDEQIGGSIIEN